MTEKFENIKSLIQKIQADKKTRNVTEKRFPVRYIFLSDFNTLRDLVNETSQIGISIFEVSQLLPKSDGSIDKQELIEKIKSLEKNRDYLLLPFSEIARFYNKEDFNNLFSQLNEIENVANANQRIYIPLLGLKARFENEFYNKFNRKFEYSFIWEIDEPIKRTTTFLYQDTTLKVSNIQVVRETKEWLNLWKKEVSPQILVLSKTLFFYSDNAKPDEIFDLIKINNAKSFINNVFRIDIPIEYKNSEKEYWKKIIDYLNKKSYKSFYELVKEILNTNKLNIKNAIELWLIPKRNNFEKWIIKNYLLSHNCLKNSYICQVLSNLHSLDSIDLLISIWDTIFSVKDPTEKIYEERNNLLNQFYSISKLELPDDFIKDYKQKIKKLDKKTKLKVITGHIPIEKELILKTFNEDKNNDILFKYPLLQKYIEDFEFNNLKNEQNWIYNYFEQYKISKLKNVYTSEISTLIDEINSDEENFYKWYYSFEDVSAFLNNDNFDYIFWIDALGIEWLSLIEYFLINKKYNIENKYIAKVNLPTITDVNRYKGEKVKYIQNFDQFIHNTIYNYPKTIIDEFEKLQEIIEKIVIQKNKRAIIISDHGLSALVRLMESSKNFTQANHEGRYIKFENTSSFQPDENYIIKDNYIIASKHISLSTKPKREVHGGCTPEEVLVPVIIFNSIDNYKKQETTYNIKLLTEEIDIKKQEIIFEITPIPKRKVFVIFENKRTELNRYDNKKFSSILNMKKAGVYTLLLKIGNFQQEFSIKIKSGFKEEDLF